MKPKGIEQIGDQLAIQWANGEESYIGLETLRRQCPCAACRGEHDVRGRVYKGPEPTYSPASFRLVRWTFIGGYGFQPVWGDGHATGIYSFDYLRQLAEPSEEGSPS